MNTSTSAPSLKRVVGVGGLAFNVVNLTIATGIFGLPAILAAILGPQAILAYLVCAVLFGLVGLCFAEAGSRVGRAGGLYAYASVPFGPIVGGVAGTLLWVASGAVADAAIVNLLVDTLGAVVPALAPTGIRVSIMLGLFALVAIINVRGVRQGVRLSVALTIIKIAPLVLLVIAGAFVVNPAQLHWTAMPSIRSIGQASVVLFYAFIGVECALSMSGEVLRPSRTVPRSILMGLLIIATLYVGLQLVAQGTLGDALAHSKAPLVDAATVVFGSWGGGLLLAAIVLSASGCLAADLLSTPRVLHALAERGQMPRQLAFIHPRFGTPAWAIGVYVCVCAVLALSGTFQQLLIISSSGTLILYVICCLGVLRLRAQGVATEGEAYRAPGGPFVPLAATAIILWMLSTLTTGELVAAFGLAVAAAVIYALRARITRPQPGG
jgi:basic amino acid/polyamine antiporter, APA family